VTKLIKVAHRKQTLVPARINISLAAGANSQLAKIGVRDIHILAIVTDTTANWTVQLAGQIFGR
jgi:hypothetical protein